MVGIGTRLGLNKVSGGIYDKILGTERSSLILYPPLNEQSGATADNLEGTAARDGTYNGVSLGQPVAPFTCPLFDGANDYVDLHTASLASAFSGTAGTAMIFAQVSEPGVWTDSTWRRLFQLQVNSSNRIYITKSAASNALIYEYKAGGTAETVNQGSVSTTDWMQFAVTWDKSGSGNAIAYFNGAREGTPQAIAGTWSGSLVSADIGSQPVAPSALWDGYLAHFAIWTKALTDAQILAIYQASGVA